MKVGQKKEMTADELRKLAAEHGEKVHNLWIIFGMTGVVMIAAIGVIAAICVAWFANNREVGAHGMSVQSSLESRFELAAKGTNDSNGFWDEQFLSSVSKGDIETISEQSFRVTSNENNSIRWAITENSHIGNNQDSGISPGSSGAITFYIIPKESGEFSVTLELSIVGKNAKLEEVSYELMQLLQGHILLFAGYNDSECSYSGWISEDADAWGNITLQYGEGKEATLSRNDDGSLVWTGDVIENAAYPVTLYWIWPETVGEYIFKVSNRIANRLVLFPIDDTSTENRNPSALSENLFSKMCQTGTGTENAMSNRYFKWDSQEYFVSIVNEANLKDLRDNGITDQDIYWKICEYYNKADQYIGKNIRYLELKLDAR